MALFSFRIFSMIVLSILMGIYFFKKQRERMVKLMEKFEGPPAIPLLGNSLQFIGSPTKAHEVLQRESRKYPGRSYRLWATIQPVLVIHHFKDAGIIFKITQKHSSYSCLEELLGDGLITSNGERWRRNRAIIEPAFSVHMLSEHIFFILVKHCINLVAGLSQYERKEFDIWPQIYKTAFNSIHDITMGFDETLDEETLTKFEKNRCSELMIQRIYTPWLRPWFMFKVFSFFSTGETNPFHKARSLFSEPIKRSKRRFMNRKYSGNTEHDKKKKIMDILLDAGLNEKDILDEIVTLFFAGSETNATTVCYTLLMLAMNQNIQKMVHDELQHVFGNSDRSMEPSDLPKLTFLEQCIKESLRTTGPPSILREGPSDMTLSDGRVVPAGVCYLLSIFDIHHDAEIYPQPFSWNPHNFDPEKISTRPVHSFIPFGAGARICLGYRYAMMAMKVMLCSILRNYELRTSHTKATLEFNIVVRVKEGFNVELHPRKIRMD